jgi:general secretion pathway protein G
VNDPNADAGLMRRPGAVTFLAVLDLIGGTFCTVAGVSLLAFGALKQPFLLALGCIYASIGLSYLAAGIGLLRMKAWGRIVQIVMACVGLIGIPVGTIISVLILIYLLKPGARVLFSGKRPEQLSDGEAVILREFVAGGAGTLMVAVVLVVVLLGGGVIAAIAIPNFLVALDRGRQKRTVADLRSVGVGLEMYRSDHGRYPAARTMDDLAKELQPRYLASLPRVDPWQHEYRYAAWSAGPQGGGAESYALASAGRDGVWENDDPSRYSPGTIESPEGDIVFSNGEFIRAPVAPQGRTHDATGAPR